MATQRHCLSCQAVADLEQIAEYLGQHSPDAADRVLDTLFETFEAIATNREIGTSLEELRPGLRMFVPAKPASNYVVFFYAVPDGIMVSTVVHSARDWTGMFLSGDR